jgi:uncharacterized protein YeaO (DUF488 family)
MRVMPWLRSMFSTMFAASTGKVTLLFGAHDTERNNAVALADYLAVH